MPVPSNFDPATARYLETLPRALWNLDLAIDLYPARYNGVGDLGPVRTQWGLDPGGTATASAVKPDPSAPTSPGAVLPVQVLRAIEGACDAIVYGDPDDAARAVAALYELFEQLAEWFGPGSIDLCLIARFILERFDSIHSAAATGRSSACTVEGEPC